jgi:hypothetical protein
MEGKVHNQFKFGLYLNGRTVAERIFDGNVYNQAIRSSVNIKSMTHEIMSGFQSILMRPSPMLNFKHGEVDNREFDFNFDYPETLNPSFKYILKINAHTIIERDFFVRGFNRMSIYSMDIIEEVDYFVEQFQKDIKKKDMVYIWDNVDLMNHYRLPMSEIHRLDRSVRQQMLDKIQG